MAAGREDDPLHEAEEILDVDVLLGDVDELELFGEEAADEGNPDAVGQGPRQLDALGGQELDPAHAVEDFGQVRIDVLQVLDRRARAVLVDPLLDAVEDLLVGQVGRGDPKGLLGELEDAVHRFPVLGEVGFAEHAVGHPVAAEALEEVPGFGDAAPAEVVHHLARDPDEQVRVGVAEEVQGDPPALLPAGRGPPLVADLLVHCLAGADGG